MPADTVNRVVPRIISRGGYTRPQLGIYTDDRVNRQFFRQMNIEGLVILGVRPGSAAESAGLQGAVPGADGALIPVDVLMRIGEHSVNSSEALDKALDLYKPGDTVVLSVWRNGDTREVMITLE